MGPGDVIAERFEIERVAGSGGLGVVYAARDRVDGVRIALKILRPEQARHDERFLREAHVLGRLSHPGIVRYVAHGRTPDGRLYLAMEWLDGEDLAARLTRGKLAVQDTLALAGRVAGALSAVHARGIVHRDLKPSNIFLVDGLPGRARLLDFGVARITAPGQSMTQTGLLVGTPLYMAPEQVRSARDVDARADVFALGCVLFECLAGRPPFRAEGEAAVLAKILFEEPPALGEVAPEVPAHLDRLVGQMLTKDRHLRPADGAAVAEAIERASADDLGLNEPAPRPERAELLGDGEQRLVSVVFAGATASTPAGEHELRVERPTVPEAGGRSSLAALGAVVRAFGGRREQLVDGSWVVVLTAAGAATDQAAHAARLALAMRAAVPEAPLVLATGRAAQSSRLPVGEAVDRAWSLLRAAHGGPAGVIIDDLTAALVAARFELRRGAGIELIAERPDPAPSRKLLGRVTPMVGRDHELAILLALHEECAAEPVARAVLVTAAAGFGKSRLCHELLRALAGGGRPVTVFSGRGDPMRVGSPFAVIGQAIRKAAGILGRDPTEHHAGLRSWLARRHQGEALARLAGFLGELVGAPAPEGGAPYPALHAARRDAVLMGDQMRRAWEDCLAAECTEGPVLLVLDDLQWGDLPSVQLVEGALRRLSDRPLMVLALARPEVHDLFPRLWADRGVTLRLGPLSQRAGLQLVSEVLGLSPADELADRLARLSAGNAFYLEELIRSVAQGNEGELPETVLAMAHSRLDALEPEARRVLRAACIFGQSFREEGVAALLETVERSAVPAWLATLTEREIISRRASTDGPGADPFAFRHSVLQQAAYASLTQADRSLGHRLAGCWLEATRSADAATLASHFDLGADASRAIRWHLRAAVHAVEGNDLDAGLRRIERAVALGAFGEELGSLRLLEAEAQNRRGDSAAAAHAGTAAMGLLPEGHARWFDALAHAARAAGRTSDGPLLARLASDLRSAMGPALEATVSEIVAVVTVAYQVQATGAWELAGDLGAWLDSLRGDVLEADPLLHGTILRSRAADAYLSGDHGIQLRLDEKSVLLLEKAGELRRAAMSRAGVGTAYLMLGAYERAEVALLSAIASAGELSRRDVAALARRYVGLAQALSGRIEDGLGSLRTAVVELAELRSPRLEGEALVDIAHVLHLSGDPRAAGAEASRAVELLGPASPSHARALAVRARARLLQGRAGEALEDAGAAERTLRTANRGTVGEALVRLAWAEALEATGDRDRARVVVEEARDRLLERAGRIDARELRESFLNRVPENARTLELASRWGERGPDERPAS